MINDFDIWNDLKKKVDSIDQTAFFPKEREVWMCALGKNIGFEQNGSGKRFSRPVLVVKKFNNQMFWVIPLSTKQKNLSFYYNFTDPFGLKVSAILAQIRLLSIKRFKRNMYEISIDEFKNIQFKLRKFMK